MVSSFLNTKLTLQSAAGIAARTARLSRTCLFTVPAVPRYRLKARSYVDTISENISRKNIIRNLQDQIAEVQGELSEVRHQNRMLQRRMAQMQEDHKRQRGEVSCSALKQGEANIIVCTGSP